MLIQKRVSSYHPCDPNKTGFEMAATVNICRFHCVVETYKDSWHVRLTRNKHRWCLETFNKKEVNEHTHPFQPYPTLHTKLADPSVTSLQKLLTFLYNYATVEMYCYTQVTLGVAKIHVDAVTGHDLGITKNLRNVFWTFDGVFTDSPSTEWGHTNSV